MIERIGSSSAEATTVTIPAGHQRGDLLLIFAYRDGSSTAPSVGSGFSSVVGSGTSTNAYHLGAKIATSSSETSGTWTNATELVCVVYRNVDSLTPITNGSGNLSNGSNTNCIFPIKDIKEHESWVVGFGGAVNTDATFSTPPTGMSLVQNQVGTNALAAAFDTNGRRSSPWPSTTLNIAGTAGLNVAVTAILIPARIRFNNYQSVAANSDMSVTEVVR